MRGKKLLSVIITLAMVISMLPLSVSAANETVEYRYSRENLDGTGYHVAVVEITNYEPIDSSHKPTDWDSGWYVVRGEVTINEPVNVEGPVHLILTDDCHLTCSKGILVETTNAALTIYSQSYGDKMGKLTAKGEKDCAGIGTSASNFYYDCCGRITVHGGNIRAFGGNRGAGIGGGFGTNGGKVTVYGGKVFAQGEMGAAGIGGGEPNGNGNGGNGGEFSIYGGYVDARGVHFAKNAAIGGGYNTYFYKPGNGGSVNLYGGTVHAIGGSACFGGGASASDNGTVNVGPGLALFDRDGQRINGGFNPQPWENMFINGGTVYVTVASSMYPETYHAYNPKNGTVETKQCSAYTFINRNIKAWTNGWYVVDDSGTFNDTITVTGDVNLIIEDGKTLTALGGICVENGASLSVYTQSDGDSQGKLIVSAPENMAGIGGKNGNGGGAFTVYGGDITVSGGTNAAAVGGGKGGNGGTFSIYGGKVNARAGADASRAIGGGSGEGTNGNIVVRGGYEPLDLTTGQHIIRAAGESWADKLSGNEIFITVAPAEIQEQEAVDYRFYNDDMESVEAKCTRYRILDESEQVLSDGWYVAKGELKFSYLTAVGEVHLILTDGSTVTVQQGFHVNEGNSLAIYDQPNVDGQSGEKGRLNSSITSVNKRNCKAAGIGGDKDNNCGSVTIHGGTVIAEGGNNSAGIGGGEGGKGGTVTIYGGNITATGSTTAAGIGGGSKSGCGSITINGGNITAVALGLSAGIGSANDGSGGIVTINGGTVTASSTDWGAGIGIGANGSDVDVTITGGEILAQGGFDTAVSGDGAGINAETLTVSGGIIDAICRDKFDAVVAEKVIVLPKDAMCISVRTENDSALSGSPFEEETDITKKLSGHGTVHFEEIEHNHDFTGEYRDNGDGTHSQKCTKCTRYGTPISHIYKSYKCVCGAVEPHTHDFTGEYHDNGDGTHSQKCTKCDEFGAAVKHEFVDSRCVCGVCNHEKYTNTYSWDIDKNGCTVTRTCNACAEVILNEYTENINMIMEIPGENCKTMGKKLFRASFKNAEADDITVDTSYGPHHDADYNGWCDLCGEFCIKAYNTVNETTSVLTEGNWMLKSDISLDTALTVEGNVTLYLSDDCTLNACKGIILTEGNSLTIYSQSKGDNMGKIVATGDKGAAGIGGDFSNSDAGTLVINGGSIIATGGLGAVGIGGGLGGNGAAVTIGDDLALYDTKNHLVALPEGSSWGELLNGMNVARIARKTFTHDALALDITGKTFTVTPFGDDAGTGIVTVALYDSADVNILLEVKVFDLANTNNLTGIFTQPGHVKVMWWKDFVTMIPLCETVDGTIAE